MTKARILLVEDDPNFGPVLKNYLELNNMEVFLAKDATEGAALGEKIVLTSAYWM